MSRLDVFISHSARDAREAEALRIALERAGVRCWISSRDIRGGAVWAAKVAEAIGRAPVFVLLVSPHSVESNEVLKEVSLALAAKAEVVPVRLADVALPGALAYHLEWLHRLDALDGVTPQVVDGIAAVVHEARRRRQAADAPGGEAGPSPAAPGGPIAARAPAPTAGRRGGGVVIGVVALVAAATGGWMATRGPTRAAPPDPAAIGNDRGTDGRAPARDESTREGAARLSASTPAGFTISVVGDGAWRQERVARDSVLVLRHLAGDVRLLAGVADGTSGEPAVFARTWLRRHAALLPIPLEAGAPVAVEDAAWEVPLYAEPATGRTPVARGDSAAGVLDLVRGGAGSRAAPYVWRWIVVAAPTPGALASHERSIQALIGTLHVGADAPAAPAPPR